MLKEKKRLLRIPFVILIFILTGLLCAKPIYNLYRDISFDWEERSEAAHAVKNYAEEKGISFGEYPWFIIELLESNPETEDFVLNYPDWSDDENDSRAYLEPLPQSPMPLFLQWDQTWGYEEYGSSILAVTGCGPTALSMAGYYLTGDEAFNPKEVADFSRENGYYAPGYGSSWTLISEGGPKLGLNVKELPLVKKKMTTAVENGHPVILALGPGDFTTTGHYIVLTGVEDGKFRVNDPNSILRSQKLWSYEELEHQIRNIWEISAP